MGTITWLHLSDWHQKGPDFDRTVVRDALIRDIRKRTDRIDPRLATIDFVVFSGDLAYHGAAEEYEAAQREFLDPVLDAAGLKPDRLFMVPGNHDMDRSLFEFLPAALQGREIPDDEVNKWLTEARRLRRVLEPFENYAAFAETYANQPSPAYAAIRWIDADGARVALLGVNSAWMCGRHKDDKGEIDDERRCLIGEPQIHDALSLIGPADIRIVVVHHPFEWLARSDRNQIEGRLTRDAHFILSGHEHAQSVKVQHGTGGACVTIPAGASYDRRKAGDSRYTNAYNFIAIDRAAEQGTVFLRRWSEQRTEWTEDTDSHPGGRYDLDLSGILPDQTTIGAAPKPSTEDSHARRRTVEVRYRALLFESCDIVNLANLPEQDRHIAGRQLELRRLYVPLRVWVEAPIDVAEDQADALLEELEIKRARRREFRDSQNRKPDRPERVPVGDRLRQARRLVILGDPGAGKTTLTRWIATAYLLRLKGDTEWQEIPDVQTLPDKDLLPILIRCRDLRPEDCFNLDGMLGRTLRRREMHPREINDLQALIRERLEAGDGLLIIDGLDEVPDAGTRARLCEQIENIVTAYPEAPIIATSRIVGYREMGYRLGRGFEHLTIADLNPEEKDDFADRWCALTEVPERQTEAAAELKQDIHSADRIERLTGNPMLLTTMALVKRKVGKLPSRRADLYGEAVQVLLNWRREVDEALEGREAIPQLEYLAYAMCDRGIQRLRQGEVLDLLERIRHDFPNLHRVRERTPEEFLSVLESRTGILIETGRERHSGTMVPVYEFRHLTIQEFLAARALVDRCYPGCTRDRLLAQDVGDLCGRMEVDSRHGETSVVESWREPIRLTVSLCQDNDVDDVLQTILTSCDGEPASAGRARAILAALCIADEPNAGEPISTAILDHLASNIREKEGLHFVDDTPLNSAVDKICDTIHNTQLRNSLIKTYLEKTRHDRLAVATVLGNVIARSELRQESETQPCFVNWLEEIRAGDERQAIAASLAIRCLLSRNWRHTDSELRTPPPFKASDLAAVLIDSLSGSPAMAMAAATTLDWLARMWSGWKLTTAQTRIIVEYLNDHHSDPMAVAFVASAIADRSITEATDPLVSIWLPHSDSFVRSWVIVALGQIGNERAVEPLIERLTDDDDADVRRFAAGVLGQTGNERAVEPLIECLTDDDDADVRRDAAEALGRIGDARAVEPLIARLTNAIETSVRWTVAQALGRIGDARAVQPLIERLTNDDDADVRRDAAEALGQIGDARAVEPLIALLTAEDDSLGWRFISEPLGRIGGPRAIDTLISFLSSAEAVERRAAVGGLAQTMDEADQCLMSRDIDAERPWLDPRDPITEARAGDAASALGISVEDVKARYEALAPRFRLTLEWT